MRIPPQAFDLIANLVGPSDVIVGDGPEMTFAHSLPCPSCARVDDQRAATAVPQHNRRRAGEAKRGQASNSREDAGRGFCVDASTDVTS